MTAPVPAEGGLRAVLAAAMPDHQHWCHAEAHGDCCRADDCDCGVSDALDRLEPAVREWSEHASTDPVIGHVECPECHEAIPFGVKPPRIVDEAVEVDADLSNVWAHAWQHEEES